MRIVTSQPVPQGMTVRHNGHASTPNVIPTVSAYRTDTKPMSQEQYRLISIEAVRDQLEEERAKQWSSIGQIVRGWN